MCLEISTRGDRPEELRTVVVKSWKLEKLGILKTDNKSYLDRSCWSSYFME
jgi:hypothetical protein